MDIMEQSNEIKLVVQNVGGKNNSKSD